MSAFSLPIPPAPLAKCLHRPTERSATTQKAEPRNQKPEPLSVPARTITPTSPQTLQHLRDLLIFIPPMLPLLLIDITEVKAIADPYAHLVAGPYCHQKKASELRPRPTLLGKTFRQVRTDRLACPPELLGKAVLLLRRKG